MQRITQEQFRELVVQDVLGDFILELRSDEVVELWLAELYDLKADTEIKLSLLDDAEFQQGSMNHGNAVENARESIKRTNGFLSFVSARINEARQIRAGKRRKPIAIKPPKQFTTSINWQERYQLLKREFDKLSKEARTQTELNDRVANILDKMSRQTDSFRVKQEKKYESLYQHVEFQGKARTEAQVKKVDAVKEQLLKSTVERQAFRNLLSQVIMQWEDKEISQGLIDEIKLVVGWDVPFGVVPKTIHTRKTENITELAS